MSSDKKTFAEWWEGLHRQSRETQHLITGVLREQGFKQVEGTPDSPAMTWERHAGRRAHNMPISVSLSREARAWLLCHLIATVARLQTEIANIQTQKLRHPHLASMNGIASLPTAFREAALQEDLRLATEALRSLNDQGVR